MGHKCCIKENYERVKLIRLLQFRYPLRSGKLNEQSSERKPNIDDTNLRMHIVHVQGTI